MKIFSWMRNKRSRDDEVVNKPNPQPKSYDHNQEEFSDWPNGLLAIGTFGISNLKCTEKPSSQDTTTTAQGYEQVVDKQLTLLLNKHNFSVDELLDCLHEDEKKIDDNSRIKDTRLQRTTSLVDRGRKCIKSGKKERGIGKKSLSFLIKKALLCNGGFEPPAPPDPKLDRSRMEKILRAMLHKKIYPQRPTTPKKYLDMPEETDSDEDQEASSDTPTKSKWVKTDSECKSNTRGRVARSCNFQCLNLGR